MDPRLGGGVRVRNVNKGRGDTNLDKSGNGGGQRFHFLF